MFSPPKSKSRATSHEEDGEKWGHKAAFEVTKAA